MHTCTPSWSRYCNVYKITKEVFLAYYSIRILLHKRSKVLIAKFRLKLTKVGKTTRPFRYDLNQIPYDYTVGVTNRFKGLHLIDRVPEELWTRVHDIVQEAVIKTIPKKKKCKKAKWLSEEALVIADKKRESKGKGEKESYTHLNAEFQRIARRDRKPSSVISAKK